MEKLDKNTYVNMLAMLESPDHENKVVAFECIKNTDLKTNMLYVMLLVKEANITRDTWFAHVPEIVKTLEEILHRFYDISFSRILNVIHLYTMPVEDKQFLMDRYAIELQKKLKLGKDLVVEIKIKTNESRRTSEDLERSDA